MKYQTKNFVKALLLSALFVLPFTAAKAFVIEMDTEFSGADEPAGTAPWVTFTVENSTTVGLVDFVIDASGLSGNEFISDFYFNYSGAAGDVDWNSYQLTNITYAPSFSYMSDGYKADGGGFYDLLWSFSQNDFTKDSIFRFTLEGESALTADMFNVLSSDTRYDGNAKSGEHGMYVAAAHVQGINTCTSPLCAVDEQDQGSGFIAGRTTTVPEPGSLALLGLGLLGLGLVRRKV